jgi:cell division protein FtsI/penicillin-binding protein 2
MDWVTIVCVAIALLFSFILGRISGSAIVGQIKYENERLNKELKRLTDRDSRGRFKGDKK